MICTFCVFALHSCELKQSSTLRRSRVQKRCHEKMHGTISLPLSRYDLYGLLLHDADGDDGGNGEDGKDDHVQMIYTDSSSMMVMVMMVMMVVMVMMVMMVVMVMMEKM